MNLEKFHEIINNTPEQTKNEIKEELDMLEDISKFLELLEEGYSLDQLFILSSLSGGEIFKTQKNKVTLLLQGLNRKGLISENKITSLGIDLLNRFGSLLIKREFIKVPEVVPNKEKEDSLMEFSEKLSNKLKEKFSQLYQDPKKKNIVGFGGVYFLPTKMETYESLKRFIDRGYKDLFDEIKIENLLIKHLVSCFKKKSFAPACKYYIYKTGTGSQLASALENYEDKEDENAREEYHDYSSNG